MSDIFSDSEITSQLKKAETFAERLKLLMRLKNITGNELADFTDSSRSAVSAIVTGKTVSASASFLISASKLFRVDPEWLLTGEGSPVVKTIEPEIIEGDDYRMREMKSVELLLKEYGYIAVNSVAHFDNSYAVFSNRFINSLNIDVNKCKVVTVIGNEMSPVIQDNDSILVEKLDNLVSGKIYAIALDDQNVICRRIYKKITSNQIILKCDNENFESEEVDLDVTDLNILGRVIAIQNRLIEL